MFSRLPADNLQELGNYDRLTFFNLSPPLGSSVLLVTVHLPSKLWLSENDQLFFSRRFAAKISEYEAKVGHLRTVLIGDLNMNPFELGLLSADGINGTPSRIIAQRQTREIKGERYPYFYNPMWNHVGDDDGPPGTYYLSSPPPSRAHWHMLDQVLIRPALLSALRPGGVHIVTVAGDTNLLRENGSLDTTVGSDHLPISLELDLMRA